MADCGGAAYARENGIPVVLFPRSKQEPEGLSADDLVTVLRKFRVDFTLLAGHLKLIPVELLLELGNMQVVKNVVDHLINLCLNSWYFEANVTQVLRDNSAFFFLSALTIFISFATYSGPTIHFVDEEYDIGKILAQRVVPVCAFDTPEELAARVLHEEHCLYVDVVAALCEDRIIWRDDGVPLIHRKEDPIQYC
ncbi:hypothetical protein Cgig2_006027 [Carnegiea gigantea]|uniref:phosphoribosylglycinamide formyltransferase 1 n=1 Tax=Carnegiea gigantea TaxID=171969 RepID=A0A9Q1L153_9CARY|nr:hypothetical protein Cgig2_006027 [Carnegiea gigantea]